MFLILLVWEPLGLKAVQAAPWMTSPDRAGAFTACLTSSRPGEEGPRRGRGQSSRTAPGQIGHRAAEKCTRTFRVRRVRACLQPWPGALVTTNPDSPQPSPEQPFFPRPSGRRQEGVRALASLTLLPQLLGGGRLSPREQSGSG